MTAEGVLEAKGKTGTVVFDGKMVELTRRIGKGSKRIPVRSITAVQWKPASTLVRGFIQFTIAGGNELRSRPGNSAVDAANDENSVVFSARARWPTSKPSATPSRRP